jgi:oligopeptide/dipeptide ABC transporter ATP-binding protein
VSDIILKVENLTKEFKVHKTGGIGGASGRSHALVRAVSDVSFSVTKGETFGIVGESGCGKSTTGRLILRLIDPTSGRIEFRGADITHLTGEALRGIRRKIQMVFQDPYASLNPRMNIAGNVGEPLMIHKLVSSNTERDEKVKELLSTVGLNPDYFARFPFEFSGGQRQRIGIARALSLSPELVIADEPVSALDVSLQAQIINLLQDLKAKKNLTYIFIAHDLGVVKHISDRIAVMYLGKIAEIAGKREIFSQPLHPYTQALFSSIPIPNPAKRRLRAPLGGDVPSPLAPPPGCLFHTRCPKAMDRCRVEVPVLKEVAPGHLVACHLY